MSFVVVFLCLAVLRFVRDVVHVVSYIILLTTIITVENFIFNYHHITKRHSKSKVLLSKYLKILARSASFMFRDTYILYNSKIQAIIRAYANVVKVLINISTL